MTEQCKEEYAEVSLATYGETFAADCEVTETSRGIRFAGKCPRCLTFMTYDWVETYTRTTHSGPSAPAVGDGEQAVILCTCTKSHEGTPPDEEGCGAYWRMEVAAE